MHVKKCQAMRLNCSAVNFAHWHNPCIPAERKTVNVTNSMHEPHPSIYNGWFDGDTAAGVHTTSAETGRRPAASCGGAASGDSTRGARGRKSGGGVSVKFKIPSASGATGAAADSGDGDGAPDAPITPLSLMPVSQPSLLRVTSDCTYPLLVVGHYSPLLLSGGLQLLLLAASC